MVVDALAGVRVDYIRLTLDWSPPFTAYGFGFHDSSGSWVPPFEPHPTTVALQLLDPIRCAGKILERLSSVQTIILEWDHGSHPSKFAAVVEQEEGGRTLKVLGKEAAENMQEQIEESWQPDL